MELHAEQPEASELTSMPKDDLQSLPLPGKSLFSGY
jgi:hypothetical protein